MEFDQGICFVERFKSLYNLIAFAAPLGSSVINFYLNNIQTLWSFAKKFKIQGAELLEKAHQKRFKIPNETNDVNRHKLFLNKTGFRSCNFRGQQIQLSEKEYQCLELSAKGMTMKSIGIQLNVSPRAVETYLDRIKIKTNLRTKQKLGCMFHECFVSRILT